jgi:hypothetical protein
LGEILYNLESLVANTTFPFLSTTRTAFLSFKALYTNFICFSLSAFVRISLEVLPEDILRCSNNKGREGIETLGLDNPAN